MADFTLGRRPDGLTDAPLAAKENDVTYSLGWALFRSDRLVQAVLSAVFQEEPGELKAVRLQEFLSRGHVALRRVPRIIHAPPMRLASFNVENMFRRPKAINTAGWATGEAREVLAAYAALEDLFQNPKYTAADRKRILTLLKTLGLLKSDESEWAFLRRSRGQLLRRPKTGPVEVIAGGRADWIGWLELKREPVNEAATRNTARVIADLRADVLAVIEAEDRPALDRFNRDVLPLGVAAPAKPWTYRHVMLVDGNDDRGIDVGLLTRNRLPIARVRSHVDDRDSKGDPIFSRDCAEYEVTVPAGDPLLLLVNHFKSKGYGGQKSSNTKRLQQARRVAKIYNARRQEGWQRVAVLGDLNDTPESKPLAPLVQQTDLRDVSEHAGFQHDARHGTYGTTNDKIDYVLLSPALFQRVKSGGVDRKGVWRGPKVKDPWEMFDTVTSELEQASDHAAIWAELDLWGRGLHVEEAPTHP